MKTKKVHRNLTSAMTQGSERITLQQQRPYSHENNATNAGSTDALSFRNFENFKMALFFNRIQSQLGEK